MTTNYNECFYFDAEKDNASSMLKKCINGQQGVQGSGNAWPCSYKEEIDKSIFSKNMERPSGDNVIGGLPFSKPVSNVNINKKKELQDTGSNIEGFTNMGEHYIKPGDCPDGYYWCTKSNKCKQVCMNCKYNERTHGKSKEFNEFDPCFPRKGVYNGITNGGLTKCTCGSANQYCADVFSANGAFKLGNKIIINVGDFGKLGKLAAY